MPGLPDNPSIAILPFTNMRDDPEQEYFSDGITDDITTALSHFSGLFVIARNSSFTYKGQSVDTRKVACELGWRWELALNDLERVLYLRVIGSSGDFITKLK